MATTFDDRAIKSTGVAGFLFGVGFLTWLFDWAAAGLIGHPPVYCGVATAWNSLGLVQLVMWVGVLGFAARHVFRHQWLLKQAMGYGVIIALLPFMGSAIFGHGKSCVASTPSSAPAIVQLAPPPVTQPAVAPAPIAPTAPVQQAAVVPQLAPAPSPIISPAPLLPPPSKYVDRPYQQPLHPIASFINDDDKFYIPGAAYLMQMSAHDLHAWMKAGRITWYSPNGWNRDNLECPVCDQVFQIKGADIIKFMRKYCSASDAPPDWRCHSLSDEVPAGAPKVVASAAQKIPLTTSPGTSPAVLNPLGKKDWELIAYPDVKLEKLYPVRIVAKVLETTPEKIAAALNGVHLPVYDAKGNPQKKANVNSYLQGAEVSVFQYRACPNNGLPAVQAVCRYLH